jgi:hypothetical protein
LVYWYDPEIKLQFGVMSKSAFFDSMGVVHHEYAPNGTSITKESYQDVFRLFEAVRRKQLGLWAAGN